MARSQGRGRVNPADLQSRSPSSLESHGATDDGMNAKTEIAVRRALDLLAKQRLDDCDGDRGMQAASFLIEAYQRNESLVEGWPPALLSIYDKIFRRYVLEPEKLDRVMKSARRARLQNVRRDVLTAYITTSLRFDRFPHVREIKDDIESRGHVAPDKRVIRRILDEFSLPRSSKPGKPGTPLLN